MRSRLAVLALTVPLGLAGLAACSDPGAGADEGAAPAAEPGSASPSATAAVDGEEVSAEELSDLMSAALEGATTARLDMRVTAGGQDIEATGEADYTSDPISVRLDLTGASPAGDMSVVLVEDTLFVRLPARGPDVVRLDLDDPANPLGGTFTSQLDPRAQARVVEQGLVGATYVGEEQVQGESLEHYAALVDSAVLLEEADLGPAAAGVLPDQVTYDLWFDADGLFRQVAVDLGEGAGEVLVRFEDWGRAVDIEAPPVG